MAGGAIGALRVDLGVNAAQFEQGMRRAQATARRTGQNISGSYLRMSQTGVRAFSTLRIGAAGLGTALAGNALFQAARGALEFAANLGETSRQIGVTVAQLQILQYAAGQNNVSLEGMERALAILNRTLGQAQAGIPGAVQSFRALGFTQEQVNSWRNAGQAFPEIAEAISRFRTEAQQAAAAQRVFGRGAADLMPILAQGRAGWDAATAAATRNGLVTEEQSRKSDELADAMTALGQSLRVQLVGALVDALPAIQLVAAALGGLAVIALRVIGFLSTITGLRYSGTIAGMIQQSTGSVFAAAYRQRWRELGSPRQGTPEWQRAIGDPALRRLHSNYQTAMGREPATGTPRVGADLDLSTARGGGGGASRANDEAARRAHQSAQELRDAEIENLRAMEQNTANIEEINVIQGQIATLENQKWEAEQAYRLAQGEIDATHLSELYARKRILVVTEAEVRARAYNLRVQEQESERADLQEGYARDRLQAEADMARTMEERRRVELDLLRITTEQRRADLARLIEKAKERRDDHAAAVAQLELDNLPNQASRQRRSIMRDTQGPLESFMYGLPRTAEQIRESLQSIAVDGLQSITDGLLDVITGARKMKDVFRSVVTSIISDLLRIQVQRAVIGPLSNLLSGLLGGGAGGGFFSFGTSMGSSIAGPFGIPISGARASGGPVLPGRTYMVGEKGPELLRMGGQGGTVIANDQLNGGAAGRVIIELRDEMLSARITEGSQVVLANTYPAMKADIMRGVGDSRRRSP